MYLTICAYISCICSYDTTTHHIYTLSLHDALPISHMQNFSSGVSMTLSPVEPMTTYPESDVRFHFSTLCRILDTRSEEHTSELQSHHDLVCRLLLEKKKSDNVELLIK